jgi:hypothetical protein
LLASLFGWLAPRLSFCSSRHKLNDCGSHSQRIHHWFSLQDSTALIKLSHCLVVHCHAVDVAIHFLVFVNSLALCVRLAHVENPVNVNCSLTMCCPHRYQQPHDRFQLQILRQVAMLSATALVIPIVCKWRVGPSQLQQCCNCVAM